VSGIEDPAGAGIFLFATIPKSCPIHTSSHPVVSGAVSLWVATGVQIISLSNSVKAKNA